MANLFVPGLINPLADGTLSGLVPGLDIGEKFAEVAVIRPSDGHLAHVERRPEVEVLHRGPLRQRPQSVLLPRFQHFWVSFVNRGRSSPGCLSPGLFV